LKHKIIKPLCGFDGVINVNCNLLDDNIFTGYNNQWYLSIFNR